MSGEGGRLRRGFATAAFLAIVLAGAVARADDSAIKRGEYIHAAAGCESCHSQVDQRGEILPGKRLAGGRPLLTPFGTFYAPNITPDRDHGIGKWSDADFIRALRHGKSPGGSNYFPAFPYTSYTGMTERDMLDLKAYLLAQPPSTQPNRSHDLSFPYNLRLLVWPWRVMFFDEGPIAPVAGRDAEWNRGNYLVNALAHCGECHTPRNFLGAPDSGRRFGGAKSAEGQTAPNITPGKDGIGDWSIDDIVTLLKDGSTPGFDFVGGPMGEVVRHTAALTEEDRRAMAVYLKSVPAVAKAK